MIIKATNNGRTIEYQELTQEEYDAGREFLGNWSGPISWGDRDNDFTFLSLNQPSAAIRSGFEAAIGAP